VAGDETVLAFVEPEYSTQSLATLPRGTPVETRRLFAFRRVHLAAGAAATLAFTLDAEQLAMVDIDGHTALHFGRFAIVFSRGHGPTLVARARVRVSTPLRLKTFRKWW
jgi:hypothetical protein